MQHLPIGAEPRLRGAVVPHAPVLLDGLSAERREETASVRAALASLDLGTPDHIVVLSPHGRRAGVYAQPSGSLDGFGIRGVSVAAPTEPVAVDYLARSWGRPVLDDPVDHGVVMPLLLTALPDVPVVGAALPESSGPAAASMDEALEDAEDFVTALAELTMSKRIAFVASANTSAGLTPRAPLTELQAARRIERRVVSEARRDAGALARLATRMGRDGGSCAAGALLAFGRLFEGVPLGISAHVCPFGVGYLVGSASQGD